ncbi:MAG: hydroxyisourate hydrolase [Pseudomonadota bacterium]
MPITLSTHVLNLASGMPASGLDISLLAEDGSQLATGTTNDDGRITEWNGLVSLVPGNYIIKFDVASWYEARGERCFYSQVQVDFIIDEERHYHVPLLLNSYGYSTYRGS